LQLCDFSYLKLKFWAFLIVFKNVLKTLFVLFICLYCLFFLPIYQKISFLFSSNAYIVSTLWTNSGDYNTAGSQTTIGQLKKRVCDEAAKVSTWCPLLLSLLHRCLLKRVIHLRDFKKAPPMKFL
jgi:hypothetical protein